MKHLDSDILLNFLDYLSMYLNIHLVHNNIVINKDECQSIVDKYVNDIKWEFIENICLEVNPNFYLLSQADQAKKRNEYAMIYKLFKKVHDKHV